MYVHCEMQILFPARTLSKMYQAEIYSKDDPRPPLNSTLKIFDAYEFFECPRMNLKDISVSLCCC